MCTAVTATRPVTYILVSGAREWPEAQFVVIARYFARKAAQGPFVLIEGECSGVDVMARRAAGQLGMATVPMPANWKLYKRAAGPKRNSEMLALLLEKKKAGHPVEMVYFHPDLAASRGTKDTVSKAIKAGLVPVDGAAST